jgi:hypothetical protein
MATSKKEYFFAGKVAWLSKVGKRWPNKPEQEVFSLNFYPKDAKVRKDLVATGIRNKMREDDGEKSGVEGFFFTLRSNVPFLVYDTAGNKVEGYVGNGSDVVIKLAVEIFDSTQHGEVVRSTVEGVTVHNLIEYVPEPKADATVVPA